MKVKYHIISGHIEQLPRLVNQCLDKGWKLTGGVSTTQTGIGLIRATQAMYEEVGDEPEVDKWPNSAYKKGQNVHIVGRTDTYTVQRVKGIKNLAGGTDYVYFIYGTKQTFLEIELLETS